MSVNLLGGTSPRGPHQKFRLPASKAKYPNLPNSRTTTREKGNDFHGWAIYIDGCSRFADGETLAGWCAVARSLHGRISVMFRLVVTTEVHLAFAGARVHSNKTAEMSAIVEALSFSGPHGRVARDACSCVVYDSKHAAGVCLGTTHARSHVQLGLSCQQLLLKVQRRLRSTLQPVYSHAGNLGNECADHAAALGAFGLLSNHNLSTRRARHSFDSVSCFATCHNLGDCLAKVTCAPSLFSRFWPAGIFVHCRLRPSRRCCAGVSKCTCHADTHKKLCCVNVSRFMFMCCVQVSQSE